MADNKVEKKAPQKADKKSDKKPGIFSKIAKYFRECKGEIKKITWPTPKTVFKNMGIVVVMITVIGLFIFGLDQGLYALLGLIMDVASI